MFTGELVELSDKGKGMQVVQSLVLSGSCLQPPLLQLASQGICAAQRKAEG